MKHTKKIIALLVILSFGVYMLPARAATIAIDVTASSAAFTTSPMTWNHTVGAGTNTLLVVGCGVTAASAPTVTGVTYNSVAMTKVQTNTSSVPGESTIWFLHNPTSGTNQVSASWSFGTSPQGGCTSTSYTGAQQIDTADGAGGNNGTGLGDKTFSVTTVANNAWIYAVTILNAVSPTVTADQTVRGAVSLSSSNAVKSEDTNAAQTPAGIKTMGFTMSATIGGNWAESGASFAPAAGSTSVPGTPSVQIRDGVMFRNGVYLRS